jgi:hypothetical protein
MLASREYSNTSNIAQLLRSIYDARQDFSNRQNNLISRGQVRFVPGRFPTPKHQFLLSLIWNYYCTGLIVNRDSFSPNLLQVVIDFSDDISGTGRSKSKFHQFKYERSPL